MGNVKWMSAGLFAGLLFWAGLSFAEGAPQQTPPAVAAQRLPIGCFWCVRSV
jgi:hypothetical protein